MSNKHHECSPYSRKTQHARHVIEYSNVISHSNSIPHSLQYRAIQQADLKDNGNKDNGNNN